jgi:hypothetical protein
VSFHGSENITQRVEPFINTVSSIRCEKLCRCRSSQAVAAGGYEVLSAARTSQSVQNASPISRRPTINECPRDGDSPTEHPVLQSAWAVPVVGVAGDTLIDEQGQR